MTTGGWASPPAAGRPTCRRVGFTPSSLSLSNMDWQSPASEAFLHMMTGPSWQWSPTSTT